MSVDILQPGDDIKPKITLSESEILLEKLYGVKCKSIIELKSYDDRNYKVDVEEICDNNNIENVNRNGYVFKILNKLDSKKTSYVQAQIEMLLFAAKNNIKCPKPVLNKDSQYYSIETLSSDGKYIIRLLEYLPGAIFCDVPPSPELFYDAGKFIANLDFVLKDFNHPGFASHRSVWMLDSFPDISQFLYVIKNAEHTQLVEEVIQEFRSKVLSNIEQLAKSVIHGDFNEQNIVVRKSAHGGWMVDSILDFGDCQYSCLLFELAVALTYMIIHGKELDVAGHFLAGYQTMRKIPEHEFILLKVCIAARLCQSLVLGVYSSLQNPDNEYILTTQTAGWIMLHKLWNMPQEVLINKWKQVAETY